MWGFAKKAGAPASLRFFNTLGHELEGFRQVPGTEAIRMYNCGPTVYDRSHIGNLRSYVFADLIRRVLEYNGFTVKQAINITDFGHLSSDSDHGDDKMTKALKREKLPITMANMRLIADKYTTQFIADLAALAINTDRIAFPRASEYIATEIALVKTLEEKGYTYRGTEGVYYDTSRFPRYGELGDIDIEGLRRGARVAASEEKRNATDFLLWKSDPKLGWDSPWGMGFPGWHIECSAMINAVLGKQIDIHTGGIDLLPTHHNNEIAQSEAAIGKRPLARFWLHHEFLNINKEKIAKSTGNMVHLVELVERGYHPLSFRYFLLGAHYRSPLDFTWEALEASQTAYTRLIAVRIGSDAPALAPEIWIQAFKERVNDDLDTPGALAVLWDGINNSEFSGDDKAGILIEADKVLGLGLTEPDDTARARAARVVKTYLAETELSTEIVDILARRARARAEQNWIESDTLRDELGTLNYGVDDTPEGQKVYKNTST